MTSHPLIVPHAPRFGRVAHLIFRRATMRAVANKGVTA